MKSIPYINNFPISPKKFLYNGESMEQLFLKQCRGTITDEEKEQLKKYLIYYLQAPMFACSATWNILSNDINGMSFESLLEECISVGIDPF